MINDLPKHIPESLMVRKLEMLFNHHEACNHQTLQRYSSNVARLGENEPVEAPASGSVEIFKGHEKVSNIKN